MASEAEISATSGHAAVPRGRGLNRQVAALLLVGVGYYLGARLGLGLALVGENVSPLWAPTGIALAAFILLGRSMWPAVAVAAFAVNYPVSAGLLPALVTAAGNTLAPLVAAVLLERMGFRRQLDRQQDALAIVFVGALASMLISATIGSAALVLSGKLPAEQFPTALAVWWTGDAMGVLVVAPFLLSLPLFKELERWPLRVWAEAVAILVIVTLATLWSATSHLHLFFLPLPIVGWASWRLQLRGAAPAALIASLIMTMSAARGYAPFGGKTLLEQVISLNGFNAAVALTSFFLAALVSERLRVAKDLEAARAGLEDRVRERTADLSAANARLLQEIQDRSEAQEQLSQEEARSRREHEIAETLQRSLLPEHLPDVPGVALAARYVAPTSDVLVGGDWYDVIQLRDGLVGLAIGDVAGHGLAAAATMTQLRMGVRAYALQDPAPVSVMSGIHHLVAQLPVPEMVTLMYLLYDPDTGRLRFVNAGHPPALVVGDGQGTYLTDGLTPPLGVTGEPTFAETCHDLRPGETLLLYTDGLVERRGTSIREGLDRLAERALAHPGSDLPELCDQLLDDLLDLGDVADDVALVLVRPALPGGPLSLRLPGEARVLYQARAAVRRWLRESHILPKDAGEVLVACGEACANVVQHAYGAAPGPMWVEARLVDGSVEITVRDQGAWRAPSGRGGGWGIQLMTALMDAVDVEHGDEGTVVRMRRRVAFEVGS
jgi:serine phosphatase RsbU (regulator of sigma subunit)/anti-sigma regulatory factor (Ser/Thr protein kinase)